MNFTDAIRALITQIQNGTYDGDRIGIVSDKAPDCMNHFKGKPVLFKPAKYGHGSVVVELPMGRGWLRKQKAEGSLLTTYCTMVGVPAGYVRRVNGINALVLFAARNAKRARRRRKR